MITQSAGKLISSPALSQTTVSPIAFTLAPVTGLTPYFWKAAIISILVKGNKPAARTSVISRIVTSLSAIRHSAISQPTIPPPTMTTLPPFGASAFPDRRSQACMPFSIPGICRVTGTAPVARITSSGDVSLIQARSALVPRHTFTPRRCSSSSNHFSARPMILFPGAAAARCICPPRRSAASARITSCPLEAAVMAACMPESPPPTTATFFMRSGAGSSFL